MLQFKTIDSVKEYLTKNQHKTAGFVPTMGTLHEGHLSLIRASKSENDLTICSVFVNPLQFNNPEDLEKYPRKINEDISLLEKEGCDLVFFPEYSELFSSPPVTQMSFGSLESTMEGRHRPGHFSGVGVIVLKFFNIIQPDKAYFGQKDIQQFAIISQMVKDLSFPIQLKMMPTVREKDGLAMSSRNLRLTEEQRKEAPFIHRQLTIASQNIRLKSIFEVKKNILSAFANANMELEYFEIAHPETLQPLKEVRYPLVMCIAAYLGNIRLIDNVIVKN